MNDFFFTLNKPPGDKGGKTAKTSASSGGFKLVSQQDIEQMEKELSEMLDDFANVQDIPVKGSTKGTGLTEEQEAKDHAKGKDGTTTAQKKKEDAKVKDVRQEVALDRQKLKTLPEALKGKVFGQDSFIDSISDSLKQGNLRIGPNPDKPYGCFFFLGPTGCGKTETAQQISDHLGIPLLRFDMSEYMEKHAVARFVGAPPGYVGFEQGGGLTNQARENPVAVVLLDEVEKAHEDILNILLQVMDKGQLTDGQNRTTFFNNTIVICTSNLGARVEYMTDLTKEEKDELRMETVKNQIKPELLNRFDLIMHFNPISKEVFAKVAEKFMKTLCTNLKNKQNIELDYDPKLIEFITEQGYDPAMGGRPARRFIEQVVTKGLVKQIYDEHLKPGDSAKITVDEKNILAWVKGDVVEQMPETALLIEKYQAGLLSERKKSPTVRL